MSHVADQPDLTAVNSEWRKAMTELTAQMTKRVGFLQTHFQLRGTEPGYRAIYDETLELVDSLNELQKRQSSILDELKANREAWKAATSARDGELGKLDCQGQGARRIDLFKRNIHL